MNSVTIQMRFMGRTSSTGRIVAARSLDELEEFFVGLLGQAVPPSLNRGCFNRKRIETISNMCENFVSDVSLAP